jgi:hypothetical protein
MKKKITNEDVARSLGWRKVMTDSYPGGPKLEAWDIPHSGYYGGRSMEPAVMRFSGDCFPRFTTSLDYVVKEIDGRGRRCRLFVWNYIQKHYGPTGEWRPLACCAGLMAWMKLSPTEKRRVV